MSRLSRQLLKVTTPPWIGTLDRLVASAAAAWSLRRLRGGYAGPCLNVRRDADNATLDVGFTSSGDLNVAALLAFVGSGNGYVRTWYDQMPGASHLTQDIASQQPQIVAGAQMVGYPTWPGRGAVMTNGGANGVDGSFIQNAIPAPALQFPQPFVRSSVLAFPWGLTPLNGNPVVLNSSASAYIELYQSSTSTLNTYAYDGPDYSGGTGFGSVHGVSAGTTGVLLETLNQANSSAVFNGALSSGSVGAGTSEGMTLGANADGSARCTQGLYGEVIEFAMVPAISDQQALQIDQCGYWQTPCPYRGIVLADGPYAYWPLDETSGSLAADISGNGRIGAYQSGVQLAAGVLLPGMGAYAKFSGASSSYVDVSFANGFCAGPAWSAECWANVSAWGVAGSDGSHGTVWGTNTGAKFLGNSTWNGGTGTPNGIDWGIEAISNGGAAYRSVFRPVNPVVVQASNNTAPAPGTANHHVVTYDNGVYSLYLNGVLLATASSSAVATIQSILEIGMVGWNCGPFNGVLGEMALYSFALTQQQVAVHYAAGIAARPGVLDGLTTPVAGAWGLRRLRGGYTGPALNVRRDSDNTTKDIGFTATGDLDIASLLVFTGSANGFVTTLYDQVASPSNLTQGDTSRQPQIVAKGILNTTSGGAARPALLASGTGSSVQQLMAGGDKLTLNQPFSRASVTGIPVGATSSSFGVLTGSTNVSVIALNAVNLKYQMYDYNMGLTSGNSVSPGAINSVTENYSATASSVVVNGTTTGGPIGSGDGIELCSVGVLSEIDGAAATLSEVIQFGALLTTVDQTALYTSQKNYWGTP